MVFRVVQSMLIPEKWVPRIHTATAIPFIYSFSGNSTASAPISTFMCLWAIYIFPGSVYIFPPEEQADPSCSQTHECGNWDWGPDIPFLGIFISNFRHFVFAVRCYRYGSGLYPDSIRSVDPDRDPVSESGSRFGIWIGIRTHDDKNYPQKYTKVKNFNVLKCWMFSFEGWMLLLFLGRPLRRP